jgi:UPF0755 protein
VSRPAWRRGLFAGLAGAGGALLLIGLVLAALCVFLLYGPGPARAPTTVVLRPGAGVAEIGATLERAHAVSSGPVFMAAAQLSGAARRLKPGEYLVPARASLAAVIRRLRAGEVVHHRITIPEGWSAQQVMDALRASPLLTGEAPVPPEGAVLPETYDVVRGESRAAVLGRMMDARDRVLAELWSHRRAGLPYAGAEQAVILASIVEKETAVPAERARVAAVYVNRLQRGMNLDADPTVIYGITHGLPLGRGLTANELVTPGPYNTYLIAGLPPTPIGNPGRASLAAVMDPPATDELYFVANGTGGHSFAATLEEQSANVARWRAWEKAHPASTTTTRVSTTTTTTTRAPLPPPPREHR